MRLWRRSAKYRLFRGIVVSCLKIDFERMVCYGFYYSRSDGAMIALQQQMTKKGVEAGAKDSEIKMILSYYKILREHQSETKANAFVIGYAQKRHGSELRDRLDALAVRILDDKGTRREGAEKLEMQVIQIKDKYYYQFPIDLGLKMRDAEMAAVLERTKQKIEERYPDDFVGKAVNYITVVIDGKKALNLLK